MIGRRDVVAGILAAPLLNATASVAATPPSGALISINGTRLWVDQSGSRNAPVAVYMHGGPGAGALDFEDAMKPALAGRVRLISVDQRGVLRSDPIPKTAKVSVADIVADFETLRMKLGIDSWQVIGHSFGGMIALHYALTYPDRVSRLTLESPAYDAASSLHWLSASTAQLLNGNDPTSALAANRLADPATKVGPGFVEAMSKAMSGLGERRQELYVAQRKNFGMLSRLAARSGLSKERWEQGQVPGMALMQSPDFYAPMLTRLAEWKGKTLLVRGAGDHVTSPEQIAAVVAIGGKLVTVPDAGHFVHNEQPAKLADLIAA